MANTLSKVNKTMNKKQANYTIYKSTSKPNNRPKNNKPVHIESMLKELKRKEKKTK